MNYWLIKSEEDTYSIDDLKREKVTRWDAIRNFQARNNLQAMEVGDMALFYHSSSKPTGVVGIAKVVKKAYPDPAQYDATGDYFDPRATPEKPLWYCVDMRFVSKLKEPFTLEKIKKDPKLKDMVLLKASRLSVQPVSKSHFEHIVTQRES